MKQKTFCPLMKGRVCDLDCGWFDHKNNECAIITISECLDKQ